MTVEKVVDVPVLRQVEFPHIAMVAQIVTTLMYFPLVYMTVYRWQLGVDGIGVAYLVIKMTHFLIITVWMSVS